MKRLVIYFFLISFILTGCGAVLYKADMVNRDLSAKKDLLQNNGSYVRYHDREFRSEKFCFYYTDINEFNFRLYIFSNSLSTGFSIKKNSNGDWVSNFGFKIMHERIRVHPDTKMNFFYDAENKLIEFSIKNLYILAIVKQKKIADTNSRN